jgi:hypothetical protein
VSSLDPYLVLIEDTQKADEIKIAYARRVFVDDRPPTEPVGAIANLNPPG